MRPVKTLLAKVRKGRLVLDIPTKLPDGAEVPLAFADEADEMDPAERARLEAALARGWAEAKAGKLIPAEKILRRPPRKR